MNKTDKTTYTVPLCQIILLPPISSILSGSEESASTNSASTKDIGYEDI